MAELVTLKFRRGTETEWSTANPVLSAGEPGYATDTRVIKIGNGTTNWNNLPITSRSYPDSLIPIAIGNGAGATGQGSASVAIGSRAGQADQGDNSVAIGNGAGTTGQGDSSVAIGAGAGQTEQGDESVAIGYSAGQIDQGDSSVAIGAGAGQIDQGGDSVAIGAGAGQTDQGGESVAIGNGAGATGQGNVCIAIGAGAGQTNQPANTIILNASGSDVNGNVGVTGCFYVSPIRQDLTKTIPLLYDPGTFEIVQGTTSLIGSTGPTGANADTFVDYLSTISADYFPVYFSPVSGRFAITGYTPLTVPFTASNNGITNGFTSFPPIEYTLPPLSSLFNWSVVINVTGGNGTLVTTTKTYPGGKILYIYVGNPGTTIPGVPPLPTLYTPGGASGVFETYTTFPSNLVLQSNGGEVNNVPSVVFTLTLA